MQLSHSGDNRLTGFLVGVDLEGRIFFSQFSQRHAQFVHITLGLGLNRQTDNRLREAHGLQNDRELFFTQGIAGADVFKTYPCANVARLNQINWVLLVGVHLENAGNALFVVCTHVLHIRTGSQLTAVNAEETQTTYKRIGCNLKGQSSKRFTGIRTTQFFFVRVGVDAGNGLNVHRRRQVRHNRVQHGLNTLVFEGRATQNRSNLHGNGCLANCIDQLIASDGLRVVEKLLHQVVVEFSNGFHHFAVVLVNRGLQICRNIDFLVGHALGLVVPNDGLTVQQINNTAEILLGTNGNLKRNGVAFQLVADLVNYVEEVSTGAVHFVHKRQTRYAVLRSLTPNGLGLWLNTTYGTKQSNSTVQNAQRAFYLHREVNVTRGIDDVDLVFFRLWR